MKTILNLLFAILLFTTASYSQTKKERKMVTKGGNVEMYNSTESKEALEYYSKGFALGSQGDYKGAIKWYKKAVETDDKFVEAYDNLGVAYRKTGDLENAKKAYLKSIELYPKGNLAHQNLGLIYWIEKDHMKALEQYKISQQNDSLDAEGYYGTIQIYFALKDYKSAVQSAAKTLDIYEATNSPYLSDGQYLLGIAHYYNNDNKNAKIYLQQAKKAGVKIPDALIKELDLK